jgi:hypothetical protein
MHDGTNDAKSFSRGIERAVGIGFLKRGDILVLDNASLHGKGDNTYLEEWLWELRNLCCLSSNKGPKVEPGKAGVTDVTSITVVMAVTLITAATAAMDRAATPITARAAAAARAATAKATTARAAALPLALNLLLVSIR